MALLQVTPVQISLTAEKWAAKDEAYAVLLSKTVRAARGRLDFWRSYLATLTIRSVAEIGVWKGEFAAEILEACPSIETYYLIDPWAHLEDWDKPFNVARDEFERVYQQAMQATDFAADRRKLLRGRALDVISEIPDHSLDFAYIDGDHTLAGVTTDLVNILPKMKPGALIGGDDFWPGLWGHGARFEPTLVFPFAVHFALPVRATIYALPFGQFLMVPPYKESQSGRFVDLTGQFGSLNLRELMVPPLRTTFGLWWRKQKALLRSRRRRKL